MGTLAIFLQVLVSAGWGTLGVEEGTVGGFHESGIINARLCDTVFAFLRMLLIEHMPDSLSLLSDSWPPQRSSAKKLQTQLVPVLQPERRKKAGRSEAGGKHTSTLAQKAIRAV